MDCRVPKKVIYWTGIYSPEVEAVSKEIQLLQANFGGTIYGISSQDFLRFSYKKKYFVHFNRPYRFATKLVPWFERKHDVSHIFHSFNNSYFLNTLNTKPIILTGATGGEILSPEKYQHISFLVAESQTDYDKLITAGHSPSKVKLIYPCADLPKADRTAVTCGQPGKFTVIFASSPFDCNYFEARGVHLLLKTALIMPEVDFYLLWRDWPRTVTEIKRLLGKENGYPNVHLVNENITNISTWYQKGHCVVAPFCTAELSKPCPNSVLEGLSLGKPALVSTKVGIAKLIRDTGSGITFAPRPSALANSIRELSAGYKSYAANCVPTANKHFSRESFIKSYQKLYDQALA